MKVLIALKSELLTDLLSSALSQHSIHICHTGNDALKQIEFLHPDILILDLMLPIMDGLTVLQKSAYKPPVILALTNLSTQSVLTRAAAVGVQDIILVPCTLRYILERLNALIKKAPSPEA